MTPAHAATIVGVCKNTIWNALREGQLLSLDPGDVFLFRDLYRRGLVGPRAATATPMCLEERASERRRQLAIAAATAIAGVSWSGDVASEKRRQLLTDSITPKRAALIAKRVAKEDARRARHVAKAAEATSKRASKRGDK